MPGTKEILKRYWGYDGFRPLQEEIINSVIAAADTMALLPTGGGKSLCYQLPALVNEGCCLVISPLIALMQDQVAKLKALEIPAACIHSGMHYSDVRRTLDNTVQNAYKLLYISPERLQTRLFQEYLAGFDITLIAVDEAHCISQWGHDFRPDYLKIASVREVFPLAPVLALTATATAHVQSDICGQLQLNRPVVFKQSFARNNIFYDVRYCENKNVTTLNAVNRDCSIIYCRSRKQTETLGSYLMQSGIASDVYHAGMKSEDRENAQLQWMSGHARVIVATTAFGMGIDKPDVRMVLHYDAPEHLEAYYQEAGRAGRDGKASIALALYNNNDIRRLTESTALKYPPEAYLRQVYQAVAEYLQIPIGAQPDRYYSFDVFDFCNKFSLKANETINALKLLEQDGLWTLTEAVYSPATIQFVVDRHVLDALAGVHPDLSYVAIGLLRMYNTIFYFPTPVRESAIAKQLKIKQDELLPLLQRLNNAGILEYNRPGEGPQLFFHHYRVDSNHLIINHERINGLRKRHEERTEAMIQFLENTDVCRERLILSYFGEQPSRDCCHCDVCRNKAKAGLRGLGLRSEILSKLNNEEKMSIKEFASSFPVEIKADVLATLRNLIDEGKIMLSGEFVIAKK